MLFERRHYFGCIGIFFGQTNTFIVSVKVWTFATGDTRSLSTFIDQAGGEYLFVTCLVLCHDWQKNL
jgi:hypothetical protein